MIKCEICIRFLIFSPPFPLFFCSVFPFLLLFCGSVLLFFFLLFCISFVCCCVVLLFCCSVVSCSVSVVFILPFPVLFYLPPTLLYQSLLFFFSFVFCFFFCSFSFILLSLSWFSFLGLSFSNTNYEKAHQLWRELFRSSRISSMERIFLISLQQL